MAPQQHVVGGDCDTPWLRSIWLIIEHLSGLAITRSTTADRSPIHSFDIAILESPDAIWLEQCWIEEACLGGVCQFLPHLLDNIIHAMTRRIFFCNWCSTAIEVSCEEEVIARLEQRVSLRVLDVSVSNTRPSLILSDALVDRTVSVSEHDIPVGAFDIEINPLHHTGCPSIYANRRLSLLYLAKDSCVPSQANVSLVWLCRLAAWSRRHLKGVIVGSLIGADPVDKLADIFALLHTQQVEMSVGVDSFDNVV